MKCRRIGNDSKIFLARDSLLIIGGPCSVETVRGMRVMRVRTRHAHSLLLSRTRLIVCTCSCTYIPFAYVEYEYEHVLTWTLRLRANLRNVFVLEHALMSRTMYLQADTSAHTKVSKYIYVRALQDVGNSIQ